MTADIADIRKHLTALVVRPVHTVNLCGHGRGNTRGLDWAP